jgi:hypothetical protein
MMNSVPTKIWIVRRGNGKAEIHPSPVVLRPDETFGIRNLTNDDADVKFPSGTIDPESSKSVPEKPSVTYRVATKGYRFFEYDVTLPKVGQQAEGGSKPGVIIDG